MSWAHVWKKHPRRMLRINREKSHGKKVREAASRNLEKAWRSPKFAKAARRNLKHGRRLRKVWVRENPEKVARIARRASEASIRAHKHKTGHCEICGKHCHVHDDHNHKNGKKRGKLCFNCNTGIGQFQENPRLLKRAAKYLRKYRD